MRYLTSGISMITVDEILDYSDCSMKYYYKYVDKDLKGKYVNISEKYDKDIKTTLYSFFINRKLKNEYKLNVLKKSWGSNWIGSKTDKELIFETESIGSKYKKYNKKGIKTIFDVYDFFKDQDIEIIAVNEPYMVKHGMIEIKGKWDLIVRHKERDEVIIFDFRTRRVNKTNIKFNVRSTTNALAFQKHFDRREDKLVFYDLNKVRTYTISRDQKDILLFENVVTNVVKAIRNDIYFAKPDEKCETCQYKNYCFNSINRIR